ncbi:MAG: hypothetical protein K1X31_11285 [Gemmatimonadaceae bacterium]|nr:hypothetical protein [Gemmatimonadaceae bacterium]
MEFLAALWLPILLSAIAVFVLSALSWTALPHHKTEFSALPGEDAVMDVLRATGAGPGRYVIPWFGNGELMRTEEGRARIARGPKAHLTIGPPGIPAMGPQMLQSALFQVVVSTCVAYLAWHALVPGVDRLTVFRITGTAAFMACGLGQTSESIWFWRPWRSLWLHLADSLVYGLATGAIFAWRWP